MLALRGALVVTGVVLVVKRYVSWVRRSEITGFYIAEAAIAVFNLIFLSVFFPVDVSFFEYAITGTLIKMCIRDRDPEADVSVPPSLVQDGFQYLEGKDYRFLNRAAEEATMQAHSSRLPCLRLSVPRLSLIHI